jgi:hypothetical protein
MAHHGGNIDGCKKCVGVWAWVNDEEHAGSEGNVQRFSGLLLMISSWEGRPCDASQPRSLLCGCSCCRAWRGATGSCHCASEREASNASRPGAELFARDVVPHDRVGRALHDRGGQPASLRINSLSSTTITPPHSRPANKRRPAQEACKPGRAFDLPVHPRSGQSEHSGGGEAGLRLVETRAAVAVSVSRHVFE